MAEKNNCLSPLISVVIPTYNRAQFITRAIDSVLAQDCNDHEIIVVDDGSTDTTQEVLGRYGDRIRYIVQKNAGVSAARNTGIRAARGGLLAFLDSDDTWGRNKLSAQLECLKRMNAKVCFTNVAFGDGRIAVTGAEDDDRMELFSEPLEQLSRHHFYLVSMLIERSLLERAGGFDERLTVAEDTRLIYDLAFETPFAYVHKPLVFIDRTNERDGLIDRPASCRQMCEAHIEIIAHAYFRCRTKNRSLIKRLRCMLGHFLSVRAVAYCIDRNYYDARRSALDALHFGNNFMTLRRALAVLLFPRFVGWLRRRAEK